MEKLEAVLKRNQQLQHFASLGAQEKVQKAEIIQLPFWPEPKRGVPNPVLRGALFAAIHERDCTYVERKVVAVQKGFEVRYTGKQLSQSDLDVWEQLLHFARQNPLGNRCQFTAHAFLKALGRQTGKYEHEWLKDVFARLQATSVEIMKGARKTYAGSLIEKITRDEITGRYVLVLNPDLMKLYDDGWTAIDWDQRKSLRRKPLALWLHGYLATHADPFPMSIEMYRTLSGSKTKDRYSFKQNLTSALSELQKIGAIVSYHFEGDLVHIKRIPSPSQQRHLAHEAKSHR